jgi:hypothetical protein
MPFATVKLSGGVNAELTPTLNQASISASNLIRFKDGLPQKLGGWTKFYAAPISGTPRALHAWEDLASTTHLGVGGVNYLGVITSGSLATITPQFNKLDFAPNFTTTAGSPIVTVTIIGSNIGIGDTIAINTPVSAGGLILNGTYSVAAAHGPDVFDIDAGSNAAESVSNGGTVPQFTTNINAAMVSVFFSDHGYSVGSTFAAVASTTIAGITIKGFYTVATVPTEDTFTFIATSQASSATTADMNGGNAEIIDWIAPLLTDLNSGYGIGGYGQGGYGSGFAVSIHTGTVVNAPDWSLDNWGELLVSCPVGGPIFIWGPSKGVQYAQAISSAPIANGGCFVSMPQQILVAWATSVFNIQDPLLIKWSEVGDYTNWTTTAQDQAGTFRIPRGSAIIGGMQGPQQGLIWSDLAIWSMQYIGYPLVFGFNEIASGCGLIGQHAACVLEASVYWMSQKAFFVLSSGAVEPIHCSVWDAIFQNLNTAYVSKIRAAANSQFNEVWWFYPSAASTGENDSYVKLNALTGDWDYGSLSRTAWTDQSVFGPPIGGSSDGYLYQHELTNDAAGLAMNPSFDTGFFMLAEGEDMAFVDYVIPDFKYGLFGSGNNATVSITLKAVKFPWDMPIVYGPYTVTTATPAFNTRIRARFISLHIESADLGSFWRLGGVKFRVAPDGRI